MWAVNAGVGRSCKSRVAVCVDCIVSPFGRSTDIPCRLCVMFFKGMSQCT